MDYAKIAEELGLLDYSNEDEAFLTGIIHLLNKGHLTIDQAQRLRSARFWRSALYGLRVDPGYEYVLADYTWTWQENSSKNKGFYVSLPRPIKTTSAAKLMHSLYYQRPLDSYGRNEHVWLRDRDHSNLTLSNLAKHCTSSASQRHHRRHDKGSSGVRGLAIKKDGRYEVSFSVNGNRFHCGTYRQETLDCAIRVATDVHEQVFAVPEIELLSPKQISKMTLKLVNPLRAEVGLRPVSHKF